MAEGGWIPRPSVLPYRILVQSYYIVSGGDLKNVLVFMMNGLKEVVDARNIRS